MAHVIALRTVAKEFLQKTQRYADTAANPETKELALAYLDLYDEYQRMGREFQDVLNRASPDEE